MNATDATPVGGAPILSPEPLVQLMQGLQATAMLQTGVQLGVFDRIAAGESSAEAVAAATGASERGTRILLDGLAALGLLGKANGGYRLAPLADVFLVRGKPAYIGQMTEIFASPMEWQGYARLAEAVRHGGTVLDEHAETPGHAFWETFAPASVGFATPAAHALAAALDPWASGRASLEVLDIACGSGLYSLTFAEQNAGAHVTLLDWANVLELTRQNVERLGLADRTSYIDGDVFAVELGGPYDLVVASHIFHHFSEERCLELLRRLAGVTRPGGRIAINDFVAAASDPAQEPFPYLFSITMLIWTREGEAYPISTYERLLETAGFGKPEAREGQGMPSRFLIAERLA